MSSRNLAKPFAIAGFILAEIYMVFTVLGPYSREVRPPPMPIPEVETVPAGTPPPTRAKIMRVAVGAFFFGPLGALVGTGLGLLASGLRGDFRKGSGTPPNVGSRDQTASP
jgi:hypothetical protein